MNELRQIRKHIGITQIQAANACGVSRRTYQKYEETILMNETYDVLLAKLKELGVLDGTNYITNIKLVKQACSQVFKNYPEVECAFLFGSYARSQATGKSDIDIMVVCPPLGMRFYGIATVLEEQLHKKIDLHSHRQIMKNEELFKRILKEGVKVYG